MKRIPCFIVALFVYYAGHTQNIPQRAQQHAKDKVDNKTSETIDKGIDSAFSKTGRAIGGLFKKKNKNTTNDKGNAQPGSSGSADTAINTGSTAARTGGQMVQVNSSSDFVPGTQLVFEDRFDKDAQGDFPAQWNTNGSGKIVTIDGLPGRWLELAHNSAINPVMDKPLPEDCSIEFDLFLRADGQHTTPFIQFGLTEVKDILKEDMGYKDRFFVNIHNYAEQDSKALEYGLKNDVVGNKNDMLLMAYANTTVHVGMLLNKTRYRLYLNGNKIIDLPRVITPAMRNSLFINNGYIVPASEIGLLLANVCIATTGVDARSLLVKQLLEQGHAETSDILFDVNKDVIKPECYPIINQFGEALQKDATLRIKIIGHTDSDGAAAANLTLSKSRAEAVKKYLVDHYAVDDARLQSDGKGATVPVASNSTADGKAKNRRVEFIKL